MSARVVSHIVGRLETPRRGQKKDELSPADFCHAKVGGKCIVDWNLRAPGWPVNPGIGGRWSGKRDSNPRPSAWKADALPLSYSRASVLALYYMERLGSRKAFPANT
jgi:hypothetical protein